MNGSTVSDGNAISDSWLNAAVQYAQERGYTLDSGCLADLTTFLNDAARTLRASNEAAVASSHVADVERLVQFMIDELTAESPEATVLHEWTLLNARSRFCPLFPFC